MKQISTTLNREYALRFLGVAFLFLALSGWFLYDGHIGYPQKNAQVAPVAEACAQKNLPAIDWMNTAKTGKAPLIEAFETANVPFPSKLSDTFMSWIRADDPRAKDPEIAAHVLRQPLYSAEDIHTQFVSAGIGVIACAFLLCILGWRFLTRITLDGETLTYTAPNGTRSFTLDAITAVDDSQWKKRGILKVAAKNGSVTLDTWHHAGARAIAEAILEKRPTPEQ